MNIIQKLKRFFWKRNDGAIGIGTMIIFIAMVLVAGIAASVLIQTSNKLESQAMTTGEETTSEVATGVEVTDVQAHVTSGAIDKIVITIRCRAGSKDIDLTTAVLEMTDGNSKYILAYDNTVFASAPATLGFFETDVYDNLLATEFGLIELQDEDGSFLQTTPVINRGDKVVLSVNATATFGGLTERTTISGRIIPEDGSAGIISFRTPASFTENVYDLQ